MPKYCCLCTFSDKLYHSFNSEWLFINFDELLYWKVVQRRPDIIRSRSNSRYFQKWLFLALFGYFWDWKWLYDNSAQLFELNLYQNGVMYEFKWQKSQNQSGQIQKYGGWSGFWKFFSVPTWAKYFKIIIFQSHMDPSTWG